MTRMYLSPTASIFAKIGLLFVECLIGLYNLITFPIRKITFKAFSCILVAFGVFYAAAFRTELMDHLFGFIAVLGIFVISIFVTKIIYKYLNKKVSPKVAYLMNSPLGIPLNRYHKLESRA